MSLDPALAKIVPQLLPRTSFGLSEKPAVAGRELCKNFFDNDIQVQNNGVFVVVLVVVVATPDGGVFVLLDNLRTKLDESTISTMTKPVFVTKHIMRLDCGNVFRPLRGACVPVTME